MRKSEVTYEWLVGGGEIPDRDTVADYWAVKELRSPSGALPFLHLPNAPIHLVTQVDPELGWVWAHVSRNRESWWSPDPKGPSGPPQWVRDADWNAPRDPHIGWKAPEERPLLVRRQIPRQGLDELLDEIMPGVDAYPVSPGDAAVLRRAGWKPEDVHRLSWTVETPEDIAALATHSPLWWDQRRALSLLPQDVRLPARLMAAYVARDLPRELVEECLHRGITDPDEIAAIRPPKIPDDATRVVWPSTSRFESDKCCMDAASARAALERSPAWWLSPVRIESGPVPVHIANRWDGDPGHFVVWDDGLLHRVLMSPPDGVPPSKHEPANQEWRARHRDFEATQKLLWLAIREAEHEVPAEVWWPWRHAHHYDDEVVDETTDRHDLNGEGLAQRTLRLRRCTVHGPDGDHLLWITQELLGRNDPPWSDTVYEGNMHGRYWMDTDEATAQRRFEELHDDLPVVCGLDEIAAMAGLQPPVTPESAQKWTWRTGRQAPRAEAERTWLHEHIGGPLPVVSADPVKGRDGTRWYDPRLVLRLLASSGETGDD